MQSGLLSRIKFARARKFVLALLAVFIVLTLNYSSEVPQKGFGAGITIAGNQITFGSGYYTIDGNNNVYQRSGSGIKNTPNEMYPYVSYLSDPYLLNPPDPTSQLKITPDTDIVIATGATVLMEGAQTFHSLTVNLGGVVSQPQPDRSGKINRYQYSDQEWGMIFYGYLKVNDTEKRKLTCPTNYYTDPTTNQGNGCEISYSPTYDTPLSPSIFALSDWQNFDKVWQTGTGTFDWTRYFTPPLHYIDNNTGSTQYYPIRIKFKNDNRDNRIEPMRVVLRDDTDTIIGSANGVDISSATGNMYGVNSATGKFDLLTGQGRMNMKYYLLNQYVATPSQPTLGWILEDFSNAYQTYETYMDSAPTMNFSTFFNSYGGINDGLFNLQFDDRIAYDGTKASTPFAKGTTGAVYDPEVYRNYAFSAKTVNPNIENYPLTRYVNAGLTLSAADVTINGGFIDVSGKGFPGYSMELRTENDGVFMSGNIYRGAGVDNAGGLSTDYVPQSAAHYKYDLDVANFGNGGSGFNNGAATGKNTNVYNEKTWETPHLNPDLDLLGSGAGSASQGSAIPSHGGNGGGSITVATTNLTFVTTSGGIIANGSNGYQVAGGWQGSGGGSGGTVIINTTNLYYPAFPPTAPKYLKAAGGTGYTLGVSPPMSSGGGGGYIGIKLTNFFYNGTNGDKTRIKQSANVAGGIIIEDLNYSGNVGRIYVGFQPSPELDFPEFTQDENSKAVYVTPWEDSVQTGHDKAEKYQIFPDDDVDVKVKVKGMIDKSNYVPVPVDMVVVSDTTGSMTEYGPDGVKTKIQWLKESLVNLLDAATANNVDNPNQIKLGLVNYKQDGGCGYSDTPTGIACSYSYGPGNYMTTNTGEFQVAYKAHAMNYPAEGNTPAGAGLNNAINHLIGPYSRPEAKKFIIFITDGMENIPPCITAPADVPYAYTYCDNSIGRFTPDMGTPVSGYPLDRIEKENIGMVSIGVLSNDAYGNNFRTFLQNISEYARPVFYDPSTPVYYDVNDTSTLADQMENAFNSIINVSQPMPITIHETLPAGVVVNMSNPPQVEGKPGAVCTVDDESGPQTKVECTINPSDYDPLINYNNQFFTISIHTKSGAVESGSFQDIDQNEDYSGIGGDACANLDGNNPGSQGVFPAMYESTNYNSFVEYNPQGPYTPVGGKSKKKGTPSICKQFFSNVIRGDVYSSSGYLNNFAFYGRNLSQSTGSTGANASWIVPNNYVFNDQAQASYSTDQQAYFLSRIDLLKGEATKLNPANLTTNRTWRLQSGTNSLAGANQINSFPDGKVWYVNDDVTLLNTIKYSGKGTIIINGNLTVRQGVNIMPANQGDFLGIIVMEGKSVIFEGGSGSQDQPDQLIQLANFTFGDLNIKGSNIRATGSFVAKSFSVPISYNRIRFYYDKRLDSFWPPGFRYFNMPTAKNTAP